MRIVLNHSHYGRIIMANGETWTNITNERMAGFIAHDGTFIILPLKEVEVING